MMRIVLIALTFTVIMVVMVFALREYNEDREVGDALEQALERFDEVRTHTALIRAEYEDCHADPEIWLNVSEADTRADWVIAYYDAFPRDEKIKHLLQTTIILQRAYEAVGYACEE